MSINFIIKMWEIWLTIFILVVILYCLGKNNGAGQIGGVAPYPFPSGSTPNWFIGWPWGWPYGWPYASPPRFVMPPRYPMPYYF